MVILFGSVLVPLGIFFALPLAAIGAFLTALPVAVIAMDMCIAYSVDGGLYDHGMEHEGGIEQP